MNTLLDSLPFNLPYITQQLKNATYEPALGIRLIHLTQITLQEKEVILIAVQVDPGKQLVPHVHEFDGEICIPLTKGTATLGKTTLDTKGKYVTTNEDKIVGIWETPQELIPGKSFAIPAGIAHHLAAPLQNPLLVLFILPKTHLSSDRKFVTYPVI